MTDEYGAMTDEEREQLALWVQVTTLRERLAQYPVHQRETILRHITLRHPAKRREDEVWLRSYLRKCGLGGIAELPPGE